MLMSVRFIALILENFEFDEDKKISIQIQLFQKQQILMNDLIDGRFPDLFLFSLPLLISSSSFLLNSCLPPLLFFPSPADSARGFSIQEQFARLRKQNLDEDHLIVFQKKWSQVVKDRAAEESKDDAEGEEESYLWNILISANERKEQGVRKERTEKEGLMKILSRLVTVIAVL
eukprot:764898-Hanusia_phi.AAC.6